MARSIRIVYPGAFYHVMARVLVEEGMEREPRNRATVGRTWISEQLAMKSAGNAGAQMRRMKKTKNSRQDLPAALRDWANES